MMAGSIFDALLMRWFRDGAEIELGAGVDVRGGLTASRNAATRRIDLSASVASNVTPGSYVAPTITVDAYGRITLVASATDIELANGDDREISVADEVGAGRSLTIAAGSATGGSGTGGNLIHTAGTGGTGLANGSILFLDGDGEECLAIGGGNEGLDTPKIGFLGKTPIARPGILSGSIDAAALAAILEDYGLIDILIA